MAGRGPAPTPTKILKMRGSWRADTRPYEPQPEPGVPTCPDWMPDEGKREWRRVCGELAGLGLLTKLDRATLAVLCQAWADFRAAVEGDSFKDRDIAAKRLLAAADRFGLSPAMRSRVQATKPAGNQEGPKAAYFKKGG